MSPVSVFQFQDPKQFLRVWLSEKQKMQVDFSLRKLAKKMEISHALLLMLLQGKRQLKLKHLPALCRGISFSSPLEKTYLQALIEFESATTAIEKEQHYLYLKSVNPQADFKIKQVDEYERISSWIHMAILAFCNLGAKTRDPEDFVKRFRYKVNPNEIRAAVSRLEALELIKRDASGTYLVVYESVTSKNDIPNEGVRKYHEQVSQLAAESVLEQEIGEREFQAFAMPLDPKKIPLAKEMIRNFRTQLFQALQSENATEVYQVNLQLFRLTERSPAMVQAEDEGVDEAKTKKANPRELAVQGEQYA